MKCLAFLFALYLLFLSGVPCNPDDGCCDAEMNMTSHGAKPSGNPNSKPSFPCSPFFACGANHGVVIPDVRIEFIQPVLPVAKLHFFYTASPDAVFIPAIWQPPKFA